MYNFIISLGVIGIAGFHAAAELNGQNNVSSRQTSEVKQILFLNSEGIFQDNVDYQNLPIDSNYRLPQNRCPLCDSSVFPYCGEKLLHDACCCTDFYGQDLPHQCKLADCRFLHANSCRQHRLIAICCCSDDYRSLIKSLSNI